MSFVRKTIPAYSDHCIIIYTMLHSFFAYMEWVELETFFSGYVLVYALIHLAASNGPATGFAKTRLHPSLPLAYALVGTLYLGLQLKNASDNGFDHLLGNTQLPYLKIWGLLSVLLWLPLFRKKPVFSILHSLIFFILLVRSFYLQFFTSSADNDMARNSMKIYSVSFILNLIALGLVTLATSLIARSKLHNRSTPH